MRLFRDNRGIYRIWKNNENGGILRYPRFLFSSIWYLLRLRGHAWDYIKEMDRNGCVTSLDEVRYPGISMYLPAYRNDLIQRLIARGQEFFEDFELNSLREKYIKEGDIICDCGAHIGNHTVFFASVCRAQHIYAFEPSGESYQIMLENIRINGLSELVTAYNAALGKTEGRSEMLIGDPDNTGIAKIIISDKGTIRVMRLDDAVPPDVKVDFLKIDTEGSEFDLLLGADRILKENKPDIFIEVFPLNREKVFSLLRNYGYHMDEDFGNDNYLFTASQDKEQ